MFNVAVVGATGLVGQTIIEILEERNFPVDQIFLLASSKSNGKILTFKNKPIQVQNLAEFDFKASNIKFAFFSAGGKVSEEYVPKFAKAGIIVIDNTSCFRYQDNVPLIIPEVNPEDLKLYKTTNIISNPNCATIQALLVLKPIYDLVGIKKIDFVTYQSVSGTGGAAVSELTEQTTQFLNGSSISQPKVYPRQIAFNVLPHIDIFEENGYTKEEMKMVKETHKIFKDDQIQITPTTARVPTFYGHSVAMHIVTKSELTADNARKLLIKAPGVVVLDDPKNKVYPTIIPDAIKADQVTVGRIRNFIYDNYGLALWVVANNVRKGAALNAIQIAETLLKGNLL